MKDRQSIADILNFDIVGNDVPFQALLQSLPQLGLGIYCKRIGIGGNKNMRVEPAFCIQNASCDRV